MKTFKYYFYRLKWWWVDKTGITPDAPINLDLELAGKCNLACTMCNYGDGSFDKSMQGMMPIEMAYKALEEAKQIGVKSVKLNFRGEPGLHKGLVDVARRAKELGFIDVFINTNLLAFSKGRLQELALVGLNKIIVSIDGTNKQDYEAIRVGGDYFKLLDNISILRRWVKHFNSDTKIILQMVGKAADPELLKIEADGYKFVKMQDRTGKAENKRPRRRCPQPRQRIVVAWDGTIFPCCSNWANEYPIGNFKDTTLREAWESGPMNEIRRISIEPNKGFPCKDCQVASSYKKR